MDIIDLIASLISGAIGGNMVGGALNDQSSRIIRRFFTRCPRRGDCWRDSTIARCSHRLWQRCSRCRVPDRQHCDLRPGRRFSDGRHRAHQGRDGARLMRRMTHRHIGWSFTTVQSAGQEPISASLELAIDEIKDGYARLRRMM